MNLIEQVLVNKKTRLNPIWIMRQAGRYLPEFREIRSKNTDFIKLCLNENLTTEITLQPLKRFDFDAAIIFSDILMLPYGLDQNVEFKKDFGPILGQLDLNKISKVKEIDFIGRVKQVYEAIKNVSNDDIIKNKNNEEVSYFLEELIQDHKEQSNLRKIESLEQKLINNLDENSYSELIKLKSQLNRE